jgi:hypothetical protein
MLLDRAEQWAEENGFAVLAIDTAEPAEHLIAYYRRRGFTLTDRVRWRGKTYESVVLTKSLRIR